MDLNQLVLPPGVIAELYRNSLVLPGGDHAKLPAEKEDSEIKQIKNALELAGKKTTLILFAAGDKQPKFLDGILAACRLRTDDVEQVQLDPGEQPDFKNLSAKNNYRQVILFGVEPSSIQLPLSFPHFQLQSFAGINFLFTPSQTEMKDDKVLKSKLWVSLRRMFGI